MAERVLAKGKGVRRPFGGEFFVQDGDARDRGGRTAEWLPRIQSVHRRRHVRQLVKPGLAYGVKLWLILKFTLHIDRTSPHIKASPRYGAVTRPC